MQISEEEAELSEWEEVDKGEEEAEEEEEEQQSQMRFGHTMTEIPMYRTTFSKPWKKLVGTLLWSLVRDGSRIQGYFPLLFG